MSARYVVGDVRDVLASMPDASVDLILTSPPFLALRAYLPSDHPDKHREIGSEATPGAFIDTLLELTEEFARVLTPHGSLCLELGDTYSGSGGAGGDYAEDGMREGAPKFDGSARRSRSGWHRDGNAAEERAGQRYRQDGYEADSESPKGGRGWPAAKSLCLIPELYRVSLVYGRNPLTGRETPRWRARNVVRWCRPNPPVGALGDKFRPATSEMVVACKSAKRWFDLDAVREPNTARPQRYLTEQTEPRGGNADESKKMRRYLSDVPGERPANNPAGAPPLDWWNIPTQPYSGSHYATWPERLCVRPILSMCPPGGTVLDPFAGSGTTLAVASGHGRDCIGIDLDARNAELALERVGPLLLTVEHFAKENVA